MLNGIKILIVEDDTSSKLYLNKILEKAGAIILNASDGLEAFELSMKNIDIDIILMDIQLPVMDGFTAARKIREIQPTTKIIAQTAYGLTSDLDEIINSGFDDYIIKPIFSEQLLAKIDKILKT